MCSALTQSVLRSSDRKKIEGANWSRQPQACEAAKEAKAKKTDFVPHAALWVCPGLEQPHHLTQSCCGSWGCPVGVSEKKWASLGCGDCPKLDQMSYTLDVFIPFFLTMGFRRSMLNFYLRCWKNPIVPLFPTCKFFSLPLDLAW